MLDGGVERLFSPLGDGEADILLRHVHESVPREAAAFRAILEAVERGYAHTRPAGRGPTREHPPRSPAVSRRLLVTQRSGAVSRMVDVGLLERVRRGRLMRYAITDLGERWHQRLDRALAEEPLARRVPEDPNGISN